MVENPIAKKIPVMEIFGPTIQGEGAVIGQQTYFIRFGLCDYKCTMCDSMHAVDPKSVKANAEWLTQDEIFEKFAEFHKPNTTKWVTLSGGNPCVHDLEHLVQLLLRNGFKIHVETQGTLNPNWLRYVTLVTISPKGPGMGELTDIKILDRFVHDTSLYTPISMKIVVFDQRDLDFARSMFYQYKDRIHEQMMFLSLGNPNPPSLNGTDTISHDEHMNQLLSAYRTLLDDIVNDAILSKVKFLPQWHVFVWGNAKGV